MPEKKRPNFIDDFLGRSYSRLGTNKKEVTNQVIYSVLVRDSSNYIKNIRRRVLKISPRMHDMEVLHSSIDNTNFPQTGLLRVDYICLIPTYGGSIPENLDRDSHLKQHTLEGYEDIGRRLWHRDHAAMLTIEKVNPEALKDSEDWSPERLTLSVWDTIKGGKPKVPKGASLSYGTWRDDLRFFNLHIERVKSNNDAKVRLKKVLGSATDFIAAHHKYPLSSLH